MILITGAGGFIEKRLTPLVREKYPKEKIFLLDKRNCDLVTGHGLEKIPKNPRIVFHLAAATDTSKRDQRCNDIGTKNLLDAMPEIGSKTHFIFTSSQAIFSGRRDTKLISKTTKPAANNRYGRTKLEAEKILLKEAKKRKFRLTIIRLPTVWGDNPRKNSFLNFLKDLVKNNSIVSRLNWPGKIGLINVDDAADFILKAAQKAPQKPRIIPVAVENLTLAEIFEKITTANRKKYRQVHVPKFIWDLAINLKPYLKYFEPILPSSIYNYFWRASIVTDSPLACKVNLKGVKFAGAQSLCPQIG
jgi:nucleoside-diphosphate-sugar epimerase